MAQKLTARQEELMGYFKRDIEKAERHDNWIENRAEELFSPTSNFYNTPEKALAEATYEYNRYNQWDSENGCEGEVERCFQELKNNHIIRAYGYNSNTLKALEKKGYIQIIHLQSDGWTKETGGMDIIKVLHF